MSIDGVEDCRRFSEHMEKYIQEQTIDKYGMGNGGGVDLISLVNPMVCVWNILRYALRCWNGKMKEYDLEKIDHYAGFAWGMGGEDVVGKEDDKKESGNIVYKELNRIQLINKYRASILGLFFSYVFP